MRGPREGKKGGGRERREGGGGERRPRQGGGRKSSGSSAARGTAAVAAAAVQGESPKRPRINNLPWEPGSACDGHIVVFCYRGFFVGDVVLINVFYSIPPYLPRRGTLPSVAGRGRGGTCGAGDAGAGYPRRMGTGLKMTPGNSESPGTALLISREK